MRPAPGTDLCALSDVKEPGAKGFTFGTGKDRFDMFVVRTQGVVRGWLNTCPHNFTTLEFIADKFLTRDARHILCATHGAQFRLDDGVCVEGPCPGKALTPLPIRLENGRIVMGGDQDGVSVVLAGS